MAVDTAPPRPSEHIASRRPSLRSMWLPLLGGIAAAAAFRLIEPDRDSTTLVLSLAVAAGLALMALHRYAWFLLAILAIRPSLDDLKTDSLGDLQPAAIMGLLVIVVVLARSVSDWLTGQRNPLSPLALGWLAFGGAFVVTLPTSLDRAVSLASVLGMLSSVAVFFAAERVLRQKSTMLLPLLVAVWIGAVVPVVTALVQFVRTGTIEPISGLVRLDGTFTHYNPFATFLVVVLLLATGAIASMGPRRTPIALVPFAVTSFVLVFTYARAAWLSFFIGMLLLAWRWNRRLAAGLVIGLVLAAFLVPPIADRFANLSAETAADGGEKVDDSLGWRIGYWAEIAPLMGRNPVTGVGVQVVPLLTESGSQPHNSFLQAAVEGGIVGLAGWTFLVAMVMVTVLRAWRRACDPTYSSERDRFLLLGSIAATVSVSLQLVSENILTDTILQWYLAVCVAHLSTHVWTVRGQRPPSIAPGVPWLAVGRHAGRSALAGAVVVAAMFGSLIGLSTSAVYRSDATLGISHIAGENLRPAEIEQLGDDIVLAAGLPIVIERAANAIGRPDVLETELQTLAGPSTDARAAVRISVTIGDEAIAEELSRSITLEAARFVLESQLVGADTGIPTVRAANALERLSVDSVLTVETRTIAIWPNAVQTALVAALVAAVLAGLRTGRGGWLADESRRSDSDWAGDRPLHAPEKEEQSTW